MGGQVDQPGALEPLLLEPLVDLDGVLDVFPRLVERFKPSKVSACWV